MLNRMLEDIKEALDHCKMLLNVLERSIVRDMERYTYEYKENEERNYGPRQD